MRYDFLDKNGNQQDEPLTYEKEERFYIFNEKQKETFTYYEKHIGKGVEKTT